VRQNLASGHKVLLDGGGRETTGTELLHEVAQLRVVDLANFHSTEVGQDRFLQSVLQTVIAEGQLAGPGCECGALSPFTRRCTVFLPSASKSHDQE
jgi:hypothetical protein